MMREIGMWILTIVGSLAFLCLMISISAGRISQIESWQEQDPPEDSEDESKGRFSFFQSAPFFYTSTIVFGICALVYISIRRG